MQIIQTFTITLSIIIENSQTTDVQSAFNTATSLLIGLNLGHTEPHRPAKFLVMVLEGQSKATVVNVECNGVELLGSGCLGAPLTISPPFGPQHQSNDLFP